jgi:hypothetical protein
MRAGVFQAPALIFAIALALTVLTDSAAGEPTSGVYIVGLSAEPAELWVLSGSEKVQATLNLTLRNPLESPKNITVTVTENGRTVESRDIAMAGNSSANLTFGWAVQGTGEHRAVATLGGGNETPPANMTATCTVHLKPLVEHPSPWYTIPCAFLFIIIPSVAIWLIIRRMRGGEWLERTGKR